jgi:hypothetical protein
MNNSCASDEKNHGFGALETASLNGHVFGHSHRFTSAFLLSFMETKPKPPDFTWTDGIHTHVSVFNSAHQGKTTVRIIFTLPQAGHIAQGGSPEGAACRILLSLS